MVVFLCIDYTLWPGWNHRGVYLYSREPELKVSRSSTPSSQHSLTDSLVMASLVIANCCCWGSVAILKHKA